jgi:hypothetical protein
MTMGSAAPAVLVLCALALAGSGGPSVGEKPLPPSSRSVEPVLAFPEPGLDDTAAYQGYQTRFYRDSKDNTVQIYLQPLTGRVVLVWADALNESVGFTVHDASGHPADLTWGAGAADVADSGSTRSIAFTLMAPTSRLDLGSFVLGSMRVERDFVYAKRYTERLATPVLVAEESLLVARLAQLPPDEQRRHIELLHARTLAELRQRLQPLVTVHSDSLSRVRVVRPSLDGVNQLTLEIAVNPRKVKLGLNGPAVSLRTRPGSPIHLTVKIATDGAPLSPLRRNQIFNREFLDHLEGTSGGDSSAPAARRLERQVRAVELLSSEEKLMAGLPNFATYFGRDMMMTALMMRPLWTPEMAEHVISSVLRKLGPNGDVSHEEALGGQAIREHAVIYDSLIRGYLDFRQQARTQNATRLLSQSRETLRGLQRTRENYHMIDDEFQLPVVVARYLSDSLVSSERKRQFLSEKLDQKNTRLALVLREMALVAAKAKPYAENPRALNLVSFPKRDSSQWRSASWRDSDAGYAGGRFAMDINVIWVPAALGSIGSTLDALRRLGFTPDALESLVPGVRNGPLSQYLRSPDALRRAVDSWKGSRRHFEVTLSSGESKQRIGAKLSWLPPEERQYWQGVTPDSEMNQPIRFLALALDSLGEPIPIVNTDPATELFLMEDLDPAIAGNDVAPFLRPFPIGLFVEGLGPLAANDAYGSPHMWERFQSDPYHGPRVVWGREVNLFVLGLVKQISRTGDPKFTDALRRTWGSVTASGLQHNELWSYQIKDRQLRPVRYGTSSDVQLWNTTSLMVQEALSHLKGILP